MSENTITQESSDDTESMINDLIECVDESSEINCSSLWIKSENGTIYTLEVALKKED